MRIPWQTKKVTRNENIRCIYMCSFKHRYSATTEAVNWAFWRIFSLLFLLNTAHVVILSSYPASWCVATSSSCCTSPGFKNSVFNKFMCLLMFVDHLYPERWEYMDPVWRNFQKLIWTVNSPEHAWWQFLVVFSTASVLYSFSSLHMLTVDATKLICSN